MPEIVKAAGFRITATRRNRVTSRETARPCTRHGQVRDAFILCTRTVTGVPANFEEPQYHPADQAKEPGRSPVPSRTSDSAKRVPLIVGKSAGQRPLRRLGTPQASTDHSEFAPRGCGALLSIPCLSESVLCSSHIDNSGYRAYRGIGLSAASYPFPALQKADT